MMTASAQRSETATAAQFKEMKSLGKSIFMLEQGADHANSMRILDENGLRPLTSQEALTHISKTPELKNQLRGKWFYIAGKGLKEDGLYTFDKEGNLKEIGKEKPSYEKTVRGWKGNRPLSLYVNYSSLYGRRFYLRADEVPDDVARGVVVGIRKDDPAEQMAEGAKQNSRIGNLLRSIKEKI